MTRLERLDPWGCDSSCVGDPADLSGFKKEPVSNCVNLHQALNQTDVWCSVHEVDVIFYISSLLVNQTAWKKITFPSRCSIHFNQHTFYWMWPKSIAYNKPGQRSCVYVSESIIYTWRPIDYGLWRPDVHILSVSYKHCVTQSHSHPDILAHIVPQKI